MPTGEDPKPAKKDEPVITDQERERLLRDIYRPDKEKFELFAVMLRRNAMYKKAKVTHK